MTKFKLLEEFKSTNDDIIKKWKKSGLLDYLDDDKYVLMANAFEIMLKHLLKLEDLNIYDLPNAKVTIFPILRRILSKIDAEMNDLDNLVLEIYSDFIKTSYDLTIKLINEFDGIISPSIDLEAEIVAEYCNNFIKEYNEKATK